MLTVSRTRVAVLSSGRAPGLAYLAAEAARPESRLQIVCCVTSEDTFDDAAAIDGHGIPLIRHPIRQFYAEHAPGARMSDPRVRERYDCHTVRLLQDYRPEVVVLSGYLRMLTRPMLTAFDRCLLNVHHADLLLRDAAGGPRYPGLRAVRDAILAGEPETRCTAHLVTERLDDGPVLLRSWAFPVPDAAAWARAAGATDVLKPLIWAQQEWMLRTAFGPLMEHGIELVAGGVTSNDVELAS
jgi:folate-dependent phosphoribosylglycinamide formyltransferase PurN